MSRRTLHHSVASNLVEIPILWLGWLTVITSIVCLEPVLTSVLMQIWLFPVEILVVHSGEEKVPAAHQLDIKTLYWFNRVSSLLFNFCITFKHPVSAAHSSPSCLPSKWLIWIYKIIISYQIWKIFIHLLGEKLIIVTNRQWHCMLSVKHEIVTEMDHFFHLMVYIIAFAYKQPLL